MQASWLPHRRPLGKFTPSHAWSSCIVLVIYTLHPAYIHTYIHTYSAPTRGDRLAIIVIYSSIHFTYIHTYIFIISCLDRLHVIYTCPTYIHSYMHTFSSSHAWISCTSYTLPLFPASPCSSTHLHLASVPKANVSIQNVKKVCHQVTK